MSKYWKVRFKLIPEIEYEIKRVFARESEQAKLIALDNIRKEVFRIIDKTQITLEDEK